MPSLINNFVNSQQIFIFFLKIYGVIAV